MGAAKYPLISTTSSLFNLALRQEFVICEPFLDGIKKVKAVCLVCNRPTELSIDKLRKSQMPHNCCIQLEKLRKKFPEFEPYPAFAISGKCTGCGRSALTDEIESTVKKCPRCNDDDSYWAKGGTFSIFISGEKFIIDLANGSGLIAERIETGARLVFRAIIPPREPEAFVENLKRYAEESGWAIPEWYLADWDQGSKHVWRHINWLSDSSEKELGIIVDYVLEKLAGDTKFQIKTTQKRKKPAQKPTAAKSEGNEIVIESGLPLKVVHYPPSRLGMIFAFSEVEESVPYLCDCSKVILETIRALKGLPNLYSALLVSAPYIPGSVMQRVKLGTDKDIDQLFRIEICHACCKVFPSLMSSAYEHGSFIFRWLYWYEKQECYLQGFDYPSFKAIPSRVEDEFTEYLKISATLNTPSFSKPTYSKARDRIRSLLSLLVKERFEIESLGGSSHAEITILKMVKELLPTQKIISHFRPDWLNRLEIDIWIPEMNIGIEYQGEQHYHPIEIWGGEVGLKDLQIRDSRKRKICKERGVRLIEIKYDEAISKSSLAKLLEI